MIKKEPTWTRNELDDGDIPVCPYCNVPYEDGKIFEMPNYVDDGRAIIFFGCSNCKKEAKITIDWKTIKNGKVE